MNFRATLTFRDLLESEAQVKAEQSYRPSTCRTAGVASPDELIQRPTILQVTKAIEPATVSFFDRYPDDFPWQVTAESEPRSIDTWFRPERFRAVQVRLPSRGGSGFEVSDRESQWGMRVGPECVPEATAPAGALIGMEFNGVFSKTPPIPIAATASWYTLDASQTLLSFSIVGGWGDFTFSADPNSPSTPIAPADPPSLSRLLARSSQEIRITPGGPFSVLRTELTQPLQRLRINSLGHLNSFVRFENFIWLRELLDEGPTPGVLDLHPARDLARAHYFDRYLGPRSWPVALDVVTLEGNWVNVEGCPSAGPKK